MRFTIIMLIILEIALCIFRKTKKAIIINKKFI